MNLKYRNRHNAEAVARYWGKSLDKPDWYKIEAKAESDAAEILIYDIVGWPFIEADTFVRDLSTISAKTITVRINSPGGDVFDGTAIFNALKNHPARIVTRVEGLAASIASIIALAGDEVQAHANTMFMIHNSWAVGIGDQHALRETADILAKIDSNILDVYYAKTGHGKKELKQMMNDETWFTAKEAEERGFVDTIIETQASAQARFDLSMFANVPEDMTARASGGRDLTQREIERALRDAGASRSFAKSVAVGRSAGNDGDQRDVESLKSSIKAMITTFQGGK